MKLVMAGILKISTDKHAVGNMNISYSYLFNLSCFAFRSGLQF